MRRFLASLALLALASTAAAQERSDAQRRIRGYANPSAAIAAELAFARLAEEKGQWTAFRETAAADAVMFTPTMVLAHPWLKDRANPPAPLAWQPHRVWSSCDGSLMVTRGAWQDEGEHGWFTTVWQRQDKGKPKWLLGHRGETGEPLAEPEMISARVADCPDRRERAAGDRPARRDRRERASLAPFDPSHREGRSDDGTLTWSVSVDAAGAPVFTAQYLVDGKMQEIGATHTAP